METALETSKAPAMPGRGNGGGTTTPEAIEKVLVSGDLSGLSAEMRVVYYNRVCQSLGLNPLTKPFAYISLNNKLVLYALRDCTDQLRNIHGISIEIAARDTFEGTYIVIARATDGHGRKDESTGAVPIQNLTGEARANAMMKAETKAKRRVTLSICGLGMLDETEVGSIPEARPLNETPAPKPDKAVTEAKAEKKKEQPATQEPEPAKSDVPIWFVVGETFKVASTLLALGCKTNPSYKKGGKEPSEQYWLMQADPDTEGGRAVMDKLAQLGLRAVMKADTPGSATEAGGKPKQTDGFNPGEEIYSEAKKPYREVLLSLAETLSLGVEPILRHFTAKAGKKDFGELNRTEWRNMLFTLNEATTSRELRAKITEEVEKNG